MGGKTGLETGLALLLAAGMAWAGGVSGGEGNRGLSPIYSFNNQSAPADLANGWSLANAISNAGLLTDTDNPGERDALRNFLSLYALTINDQTPENANGGWEDMPLQNGEKVRKALFGGGTRETSLVQKVLVGDGPTTKKVNGKNVSVPADKASFPRMLSALKALEVNASNWNGHEHHFHIDIRTPIRADFGSKLLAESVAQPMVDSLVSESFEAAIAWARADLNLDSGEECMLTVDLPETPPATPVVLIAQAPKSASSAKERIIGTCQPINYHFPPGNDGAHWPEYAGGIDPQTVADLYFRLYEKRTNTQRPPLSSVEVLTPPQHGKVVLGTNAAGSPRYNYVPDVNFIGKDKAVFRVMTADGPVIVHYYLVVTDKGGDDVPDERFCKKPFWKILLPSTTLDPNSLQPLLSYTGICSAADVQIADLTGGAVGQTTGTTLTLDANAANHGWYIDYTPYLNEEYLPTSNPNEWVAKEGSAASGKMDLLSVLLHEYGHALGIDHSHDAHDLMAATLAPGVRRMPSSEELALMARLVGEAKGSYDVPLPTDPASPDQPGAPFPSNGPGR